MPETATPPCERPTPARAGQFSLSGADVLLALIPLSFTASLLACAAFEVSMLAGLAVAASVGFAAIVYGIYFDPPIAEE